VRFKLVETITVLQPLVELGDPHVCDDDKSRRSIIRAMYESLVERDETSLYIPALAKSWHVSDDARTWVFRLRDEVRVHYGGVIKAKDVLGSIRRSMDPSLGGALGTQGLYQSYLGDAELQELDNQTVRIVTKQPFADLLDLLVEIPIVSMDAISNAIETAGSGPYRLLSRREGEVIMESFPDYWRGKPAAGRVQWIVEPDETKRIQALRDGRADIVSGITVAGKRTIENLHNASAITYKSSVCVIFMFNLLLERFNDTRVRQALNFALKKPELIASIKDGDAHELNGPLTPLHFGYDPLTPAYPYDLKKARELLSDAGFSGAHIVLDVPIIHPDEAPRLAREMAKQYQEIGIQTEVKEFSDREAYAQTVRNKGWTGDLCCFDSSPLSTYRVLREKLHSAVRGPWWQGYTNQNVDTLVDQAQTTVDPSRRQAIYRHAYRIIRDDAPWLFLYNPNLHWGISNAVKRCKPGMDGLIHLPASFP